MPRVEVTPLRQGIVQYLRTHAARYQLRPETTEVRPILNWGGFVNWSFAVTDGHRAYHLKLAGDAGHAVRLRRWWVLRRRLAARYRAPAVVDWLTLPEPAAQGLLLRHVAGHPVDLALTPSLVVPLLELIARLHEDDTLAGQLRRLDPSGRARTHAEAFRATYIERFDEDLEVVGRGQATLRLPGHPGVDAGRGTPAGSPGARRCRRSRPGEDSSARRPPCRQSAGRR